MREQNCDFSVAGERKVYLYFSYSLIRLVA